MDRFSPTPSLRGAREVAGQQFGFALQSGDQTIEPVSPQDRAEFRALRRQLADRTVEIDVANLPGAVILTHRIVDADRLAVRFDDARLDGDARTRGVLPDYFQPLARIAVETVGISRGNVGAERSGGRLLLGRRQRGPGRANGETSHQREIKQSVDDGLDPRVAPALAEGAGILHRADQSLVEVLHAVLGT